MPTSWDQKRAQIAQALAAGGGGSGWGGFANSVGAGIMANPLLRWGDQGAAAPEMAGGQGGGQGLMGSNAYSEQAAREAMPGYNYVAPTHADPVPAAAAAEAALSPQEGFRQMVLSEVNPEYYHQRRGLNVGFGGQSDHGGYSTSGRGGTRSSSWGGAQRGGGGLY